MAGTLFTKEKPTPGHRHEVDIGEEDRTLLYDECPANWAKGDPVVLLVHGIAGCAHSPYQLRLMRKLSDRGVRTFRMDLRGHGDSGTLAAGIGHAGRSADVGAVVRHVERLAPDSDITLVGYSMGGNLVLKLAGEEGTGLLDSKVRLVIAIAPPVAIEQCSRNLDRGWNRIYGLSFIRLLRKQMAYRVGQRRQSIVGDAKTIYDRFRPTSIFQFDDQITAPLSGYEDAIDYYNQASSAPLLPNIAVPTVIFLAEDDPIIPMRSFESIPVSATTRLVVSANGGHLGYVGSPSSADPDRWWIDWRILDLVDQRQETAVQSKVA